MAEEEKRVRRCNTSYTTSSNWSDLHVELLELILKRLALVDMTRVKLVSPSWFAAAKSYISGPVYKPLLPQTPWLMLHREHDDADAGHFFSLSEKKVYTFKNLFQGFGEAEWCPVDSSHGWLVMWDSKAFRVHLFNPISRVRVKLPPLGLGFEPRVRKVVLSSDPSRNNKFYVVVRYVEKQWSRLAFHKHGDGGDNTWTDFECEPKRYYDEIIFHKTLLFVLCLGDSKSIQVWDFGGTYPIRTMEFQPPERGIQQPSYHCYLVESLGEILLVEKLKNLVSRRFYYDIHKLKVNHNKWEKVERLQGRALVLSEYRTAAMSLSTVDFPELEANSIYEAQEGIFLIRGRHQLSLKVEAYNLEDKGFKSYYVDKNIMQFPLFWIVLNPCTCEV